ncbi:MAG: glycosyltransferase family 25 protein [Candidatus Paceibacterota bacterium]
MKIFVISLKRSHERKESISSQLETLGLRYEFIEGVDGKNFTPKEQLKYDEGKRLGTHTMSPGLFGSAWAHIRACEEVIKRELPYALILEDDIYVGPEIKRILSEEWINSGYWDFVHLGYSVGGFQLFRSWLKGTWFHIKKQPLFVLYALIKLPYICVMYTFEAIRQNIRVRFASAPVRFYRPVYLGSGYLVSQSGAKKILSIAYPIRYEGDRLFNQARTKAGLRFFGYCPPPIRTCAEFGTDTL